ncbi:hypothetical protein K2173_010285 [Erythroxylum novogranatense]|uniref:Transmembrane protein n=1 Tax=Erythroxylum novogranatense TaxID=1862640 RepID=A0AAV8TFK3_9ROSI|nr:hypothetical protein K2173_010285 [Erythroxylum novogranatense]
MTPNCTIDSAMGPSSFTYFKSEKPTKTPPTFYYSLMGCQAKFTTFLFLLFLFVQVSVARLPGSLERMKLRNSLSEENIVIAETKTRKLAGMDEMVDIDYEKDPGPNTKHDPPKGGGH